jgi:hypothetical protein
VITRISTGECACSRTLRSAPRMRRAPLYGGSIRRTKFFAFEKGQNLALCLPNSPVAGGGRSGVLLPQKYHPFRKPPRNLRCATDGVVVHNENFRTDTLLSQRRFDRLRQEGFAASHRDHNACQTGCHTHHRISAGASAATGQIASQPLPNFNRKHGTRRAAPSPAARSRPPATGGPRPGPWPERFQHAAKHQVRNNPLVSSSYLE